MLTPGNYCQQLPLGLGALSVFPEHILPFLQARVKLGLLRMGLNGSPDLMLH